MLITKFLQVKNTKIKICTYPSYMFFIDYNGDVLMCSHDWSKEKILGNLNEKIFFKFGILINQNLSEKILIIQKGVLLLAINAMLLVI